MCDELTLVNNWNPENTIDYFNVYTSLFDQVLFLTIYFSLFTFGHRIYFHFGEIYIYIYIYILYIYIYIYTMYLRQVSRLFSYGPPFIDSTHVKL